MSKPCSPSGLRWAVVDRTTSRVAFCHSKRQARALVARPGWTGNLNHETIATRSSQQELEALLGLPHQEPRIAGRWVRYPMARWWKDGIPSFH